MVLAAIKSTFTGGETAMQSPLPFPDFDTPPLRLVKASAIKSAALSPMAFYFDGSSLQALKYRDGETHSSFGSWMTPGSGYREFSANENGYAQAYMSCVWAFRAINVLVQKVSEVLRRGEVVNKQTGQPVHDHLFQKALDLAYTFYQQDVYEDWLLSKALYGETYVELVSAFPIPYSIGVPRTVRVLNALGVEPIIQRGMIAGYRYDGDDGKEQFAPDDVAFDKYRNPVDDVRGLSLLSAALDAVNIDRSLVIFTRAHLKNNARPGLIFTPKEGRLSQADVDLIQTTLSEDVKGAQNAGNPLLMPTAFDVTTAAAPNMDDLLGTTGDQAKRRICSAVGVPVALVDYTDMAFQLSPEQNKTFYELSVLPNAEKVARVINAQILPFFDPTRKSEFKLPLDNVRAGLADPKSRTEIADMRLRAGAITLNEYREMLDMKPTVDGNVRFLPMGATVVKEGMLGQTPAPLPQTPPSPLLGAGNGNVEPAQPPAVDVPPTPSAKVISDEARIELKNWRIKIGNKGRNCDFVVTALATETADYVRAALKTSEPLDAIFDRARDIELETLKKNLSVPAQYASPEEYVAYWGDYDRLMTEIGDDWLTKYMREALAHILEMNRAPTVDDVNRILERMRGELVSEWVGTEENPGSLTKLMLAGMGAGQIAMERGRTINPARPAKAITMAIDWNLLTKEAYQFIQNYAFNLIRQLNQTTLSQLQAALQTWITSGEPLDTLKEALTQVFNNPVRASIIAETETTRAYTEGAFQRWRDAGVTKARWQTVRDSHVCPTCAPLHNQIGTLGQGWQSSIGYIKPPAHPRCRCFSRPVLDEQPTREQIDQSALDTLARLEALG